MDDHLGISMGIEAVATAFQLPPKLREVVGFAVINYPDALVFVVNGLVSAAEVNDAQPPHAQPNRTLDEEPLIVGAAVHDGVAHLVN